VEMPAWTLSQLPVGSAIIFGSEVVHGTRPIERGHAVKAFTFIVVPSSWGD
jgi:predicted 2-oxoglutarate/Fe(II)-dependent dioxygenase YbiX